MQLCVRFLLFLAMLPTLNAIVVSPSYLSSTYQQGNQPPSAVNLAITSGVGDSSFTVQVATNPAGWLDVSPLSGSVPAVLQVRVLPGGLAVGDYLGLITVKGSVTSATVTIALSVRGSAPTTPSSQLFRLSAVPPCRVVDTRVGQGKTGAFGPPTMNGGETRQIPIPLGTCGIPSDARAYSLNITVVPAGPLSYLSIWPTGQAQPLVSTLNSFEGRIVANAAVVPAGTNGSINVYVTDKTDVIIDINGYFVP
ncbi:MAG: hypothetical protein ACKV22_34380 [Bryobacteraceae bacterium]